MREPSRNRALRCAIYTRKSSEEGLDQDFNSLEAQREACEAYVRSQAHEGWKLLADHFDDGGFSGGNMDRPGLTRLMEKVRKGEIDIIVIYKIDRLTRSLMDFAKLAEAFDKHEVSFVSVTQQFNTTTSMGRLMLNVLLSFAQFERELTGERIRDKFAASKRRGMWMGGPIPLGYDVQNRGLVVNESEAETVRTIFRLYLEAGNVRLLQQAAEGAGFSTKSYAARSGRIMGGQPFSRGHLYKILSNPLYIGEVSHKGERHKGQHEPIIDKQTWNRVQASLADNTQGRRSRRNAKEPSLLAGLLFDERGNKLIATHTVKDGRRYRYYVSRPKRAEHGSLLRIPASEIEPTVLDALIAFLRDGARLSAALDGEAPRQLQRAMSSCSSVADDLEGGPASRRHEILPAMIRRVEFGEDALRLVLIRKALSDDQSARESEKDVALTVPMTLSRRGAETRLIVDREVSPARLDEPLIRAVARGRVWLEELVAGEAQSLAEIGYRVGVSPDYVKRLVDLAFLSPAVVDAILNGHQRRDTSLQGIAVHSGYSVIWADQVNLLVNGRRWPQADVGARYQKQ
jgi:site-specific DNA recombinase